MSSGGQRPLQPALRGVPPQGGDGTARSASRAPTARSRCWRSFRACRSPPGRTSAFARRPCWFATGRMDGSSTPTSWSASSSRVPKGISSPSTRSSSCPGTTRRLRSWCAATAATRAGRTPFGLPGNGVELRRVVWTNPGAVAAAETDVWVLDHGAAQPDPRLPAGVRIESLKGSRAVLRRLNDPTPGGRPVGSVLLPHDLDTPTASNRKRQLMGPNANIDALDAAVLARGGSVRERRDTDGGPRPVAIRVVRLRIFLQLHNVVLM